MCWDSGPMPISFFFCSWLLAHFLPYPSSTAFLHHQEAVDLPSLVDLHGVVDSTDLFSFNHHGMTSRVVTFSKERAVIRPSYTYVIGPQFTVVG